MEEDLSAKMRPGYLSKRSGMVWVPTGVESVLLPCLYRCALQLIEKDKVRKTTHVSG